MVFWPRVPTYLVWLRKDAASPRLRRLRKVSRARSRSRALNTATRFQSHWRRSRSATPKWICWYPSACRNGAALRGSSIEMLSGGCGILAARSTVRDQAVTKSGEFHNDPADQIIVATARIHNCQLSNSFGLNFTVQKYSIASWCLVAGSPAIAVVSGIGTLTVENTETGWNGRASSSLTVEIELCTITVKVAVEGMQKSEAFVVKAVPSPDYDLDGSVGFADFTLFRGPVRADPGRRTILQPDPSASCDNESPSPTSPRL